MEHRDDDDDDVSFAKWMSSFWGHSWRDKDERGLGEYHRPQDASYRKTSLPCPLHTLGVHLITQVLAKPNIALNVTGKRSSREGKPHTSSRRFDHRRFPALPSISSSDCHPRRHSHEDQEFRNHPPVRYYRKYSVDESFKRPVESKRSSHSKIQEFSDSFEQQLCLKSKHVVSSGPQNRKERNERQRVRTEMTSHKNKEDGRSSTEEEHRDGPLAPLDEKGPE